VLRLSAKKNKSGRDYVKRSSQHRQHIHTLPHKHKQMKRKTNAEHCVPIRPHPVNVLHALSILSLLFVGEGDAAVVPWLLIDLMI